MWPPLPLILFPLPLIGVLDAGVFAAVSLEAAAALLRRVAPPLGLLPFVMTYTCVESAANDVDKRLEYSRSLITVAIKS